MFSKKIIVFFILEVFMFSTFCSMTSENSKKNATTRRNIKSIQVKNFQEDSSVEVTKSAELTKISLPVNSKDKKNINIDNFDTLVGYPMDIQNIYERITPKFLASERSLFNFKVINMPEINNEQNIYQSKSMVRYFDILPKRSYNKSVTFAYFANLEEEMPILVCPNIIISDSHESFNFIISAMVNKYRLIKTDIKNSELITVIKKQIKDNLNIHIADTFIPYRIENLRLSIDKTLETQNRYLFLNKESKEIIYVEFSNFLKITRVIKDILLKK